MHAALFARWHKIADSEAELDFGNHGIAVVTIREKKICIGRHQQELFGFAYTCPHAGGLMSEGYIDPLGNVVCPEHGYKFNMKNGRNTSGEGYHLKHWEVEKRQDGIYISISF